MNDNDIASGALAMVLIGFAAVVALLYSFASSSTVVTTITTTTSLTSIVDELIPAISMTAPSPVLSESAASLVLDIRDKTESEWIESLSDADLLFYVRAVCADFDQSLWFWDMYEDRLDELMAQGWIFEATSLQIVMGDGVVAFCAYNEDRLPSELLGD